LTRMDISITEYFFKVHQPWLRSGKPYGLD